MDSKYVRSLIEKFELSLDENERMVRSLNNLGDTLGNLDKSISKVDKSFIDFYKINDVENITEKSIETISSLQIVKKQSMSILSIINEFKNTQVEIHQVQSSINNEYEELLKLNNEKLNLKKEIQDFKEYIKIFEIDMKADFERVYKVHEELSEEVANLNSTMEINNSKLKHDLLNEIKIFLTNSTDASYEKKYNTNLDLDKFLNNEKSSKYLLGECIKNRYKTEQILKYENYKFGEKTPDYIKRLYASMQDDSNIGEDVLKIVSEYIECSISKNSGNEYYTWFKENFRGL